MLEVPMRKFIVLAVSLMISACAAKQTPPTNAAGCPGGTASGEWAGTGTDNTGNWIFAGTLRQEGTRLTGTFAWNNTQNGSSAKDEVEGTVQCETGALTMRTVKMSEQVGTTAATVYTANFSPDFATMTGTWDVGGGGKFTAARK
jgi:hypothetical protein